MLGNGKEHDGCISLKPWACFARVSWQLLSCSRQFCLYMFFNSLYVRFKNFKEIIQQGKMRVSSTVNEAMETELCNIEP